MFKVLTLEEAFKYDGQHICKSIPTQLKFRLVATEARDSYTVDMTAKVKVKVKVNESDVEEERDPVDVKLYPLYHSEAVDRNYGTIHSIFQLFVKICNSRNELHVKSAVTIFKTIHSLECFHTSHYGTY